MKIMILKRAASYFIDVMSLGLIMAPAAFLISYFEQGASFRGLFAIVGVMVFLFKDFYSQEGSFGKRMLGLKLLFSPNLSSRKIQALKIARNIPLILWPLEGLIAVLNGGKRLGDLIVKSEVVLT